MYKMPDEAENSTLGTEKNTVHSRSKQKSKERKGKIIRIMVFLDDLQHGLVAGKCKLLVTSFELMKALYCTKELSTSLLRK